MFWVEKTHLLIYLCDIFHKVILHFFNLSRKIPKIYVRGQTKYLSMSSDGTTRYIRSVFSES